MHTEDTHFRQFATSLESAIKRFGVPDGSDFLKMQKRQVESLVALEKDFRTTLIEHYMGEKTYRAFIRYICDKKRNILAARPYFRERQEIFTSQISKALRDRNIKKMQKFNFNFNFVQFVLGSFAWKKKSKLMLIAKKIADIRHELVTMNMPLAISRARIFYSRTPRAQLEYMDLVQIACEGLMSGIDKFVLPFSKVFRSVAIGRMTGNFIENYSETLVHFYPVDKRKIYRANKLIGRQAEQINFEELAKKVNDGVERAARTTPSELAGLLAAQSYVSTDQSTDNEDPVRIESRFAAPSDCQPDIICERMDTYRSLNEAIAKLTPLEQKLLKLRGLSL